MIKKFFITMFFRALQTTRELNRVVPFYTPDNRFVRNFPVR